MSQPAAKRNLFVLNVRIEEPCQADWDAMPGTERVKFCGSCRKEVHNFSVLSKTEALWLVTKKGGRLCVKLDTPSKSAGKEGELTGYNSTKGGAVLYIPTHPIIAFLSGPEGILLAPYAFTAGAVAAVAGLRKTKMLCYLIAAITGVASFLIIAFLGYDLY